MKQYKDLIIKIKDEGVNSSDRTGTGTRRIFGTSMEFDCSESFPLVTCKYTHFPAILHELLWFLSGDTNIKYLQDNNVTIWDSWATEEGEIGPMYGSQWRNANATHRTRLGDNWVSNGTDQLAYCIDLIKNNPFSRRIIVDAWNVKFLPDESLDPVSNAQMGLMSLAPCHMFYQFFVDGNHLDIQVYQRSVDAFLGLPFNIASYATLLYMIAAVTGKKPRMLKWLGGDTHLYNNHMAQTDFMLDNKRHELPTLSIDTNNVKTIDDFKYDMFTLNNYTHSGRIKGEISV